MHDLVNTPSVESVVRLKRSGAKNGRIAILIGTCVSMPPTETLDARPDTKAISLKVGNNTKYVQGAVIEVPTP